MANSLFPMPGTLRWKEPGKPGVNFRRQSSGCESRPDSNPGDWPPPRIWAPNGPASSTSIHRHHRRAEAIRLLSGWYPYHHLLPGLDWNADWPL